MGHRVPAEVEQAMCSLLAQAFDSKTGNTRQVPAR